MSRKPKILIVNNNLHIGGVQKSLVNLLQLICADYEVHVLLFSKTGAYLADVPKEVKVFEAKFPLNTLGMSQAEATKKGLWYGGVRAIFAFIARCVGAPQAILLAMAVSKRYSGYDAAIAYSQPAGPKQFYNGSNEFVLRRVTTKRKLTFLHADIEKYGGDVVYCQKMYRNFNAVVACSQGCKDSLTRALPEFTDRCLVLPNLHDANYIKQLANTDPVAYEGTGPQVVLVSRVTFDKGVDIAIRAAQAYHAAYAKPMHLHIIGEGKDLVALQDLARQLALDSNITFYGVQTNPYRFMSHADMLLLTSRHEAAPMVFTEARILGLPIVATPSTSTRELIEDVQAGVVCQSDPAAISAAIHSMYTQKHRYSTVPYQPNKERQRTLAVFERLVRLS